MSPQNASFSAGAATPGIVPSESPMNSVVSKVP